MALVNPTDLRFNPAPPNGSMFFAESETGGGVDGKNISLQQDNSQIALPVDIYYNNMMDVGANGAAPNILGYASQLNDIGFAATMMRRVLPWQSTIYPWMWARSLTNVHGIKSLGKETVNFGMRSVWHLARGIVTFTSRSYSVLSDAKIQAAVAAGGFAGDESQRYVTQLPKPTAEFLTCPPGQFKFVEGKNQHPNQVPVPLGLNLIQVKVDLQWTWHGVADKYLMIGGRALNIERGLGCVNDDVFHGYPAGTLLLIAVDIKPIEEPVSPLLLGLPSYMPPRAWEVTFSFKFWDPTLGAGATTHGHNTAFWLEDMRFYLIKSLGSPARGGVAATAPQTLYQTYNFAKFFQQVTA